MADWYRHAMGAQANIGLEVILPAAAKAEFERIRAVLDAVNLDVSKAAASKPPKITHTEWLTWEPFYKKTHAFLNDASKYWGANVDQARAFEQEIGKWRNLVQSRGATTSGPANLIRPPDDKSTPGWVIPAITVGGLIAVGTIINAWKK